MNILLLVDQEAILPDDPEFLGLTKEGRGEMEGHVAAALRQLGHTVHVLPFGPDALHAAQALSAAGADLVFNLTERIEGDRRKDAHVAAVLELLGLPYTGTGLTGLVLCRDKALCKRILTHHRIRVPRFGAVPPGRKPPPAGLRYPAVVKPLYEDGSDGISLASLVHTPAELQERILLIHERMHEPAICEEYIEGRELYVGLLGHPTPRALPAWELEFGKVEEGGPAIATARVKWDAAYRRKWGIRYRCADLPPDLEKKVARTSRRIFEALHLRDYARVDLRLTPDSEIVCLEANPNPDLSNDAELALAAAKAGIEYSQLIDRIAKLALRRK